MNKNVLVKEYEFEKPLIHKIDSVIDTCIIGCNTECFHTFDHICVYDIKLTNIINNETVNQTISDKNMSLYELNKNLKFARNRDFIFNQTKKLTKKNLRKAFKYSYTKFFKISNTNNASEFF